MVEAEKFHHRGSGANREHHFFCYSADSVVETSPVLSDSLGCLPLKTRCT